MRKIICALLLSTRPRILAAFGELRFSIAQGRIGSASLERFREPENTVKRESLLKVWLPGPKAVEMLFGPLFCLLKNDRVAATTTQTHRTCYSKVC